MKSRHLFGILLGFILLCAALSGCGGPSAEQPTPEQSTAEPPPTWRSSGVPDATPPRLIRVGDVDYYSTGTILSSDGFGDREILGYLTYTGSLSIVPENNGESNVSIHENAPYARSWVEEHPDGLMVYEGLRRWCLWIPDDSGPLNFIEGPDGSRPTVIKVEDALYMIHTKLDPDVEIEDSQILGYLTYNGDGSLPRQNGECNYHGAEGAPYARYSLPRYPECMVARLSDDQWWSLTPYNGS